MAGIAITRLDLTAAELRAAAGRTKDARAVRRMLAIALVLDGVDRTTAAQTCGMDRQTLRDWVHRYNAEGLAGLVNRTVLHRPRRLAPDGWPPTAGTRRLAPDQMAELADWVEAGPDPVRDGVVRWRRKDLQARIAAVFGVTLHERSAGKQLAALGFRRHSVSGGSRFPAALGASAAPEVGPAGAGSVQKNFPEAVAAAIPARARDKPLEVWFQDEARVGQQGTLTRIWARRGARPRAPATPAINGRICSVRSAPHSESRQGWSCPSSTPRR